MSEASTGNLQRTRERRASDGASALIYQTQSAQILYSERFNCRKQHTYITCLMDDIRSSLNGMGVTGLSKEKMEEWAIFIHACMSENTRGYHSIDRIFEISAGADAYQLLAGLFRDTINRFVDGGLSQKQLELLEGVLEDDGFTLSNRLNQQDTELMLAASLFGLEAGQDLRASGHGLDAFLSAVMVSRLLQDIVTYSHLARVIVCLEATIPFRTPDYSGVSPLDGLYQRLTVANKTFELDLNDEDLVESIQRAADWSNRSLGNFSAEDAAVFLDHTWSLLPEQNSALRRRCLFTVTDFQLATSNMVKFLTTLDPTDIFISFRGVPDETEMAMFNHRTSVNLDLGLRCMRAELLSVSIVASVAILTGGDAPISFFTGDFPSSRHCSDRLGDDFPVVTTDNCDEQVYTMLRGGRSSLSTTGMGNSLLAAYVYGCLGDEGVRNALDRHVSCPMSQEGAQSLLESIPADMLKIVGRDIAGIAISRAERIKSLLQEL